MKGIGIICLQLLTFLTVTKGSLSDTITKCILSDSACLTAQAQTTLKTFVDGIPELGIQKLDPLSVDDIKNVADDFNFIWTDVTVRGLRNAVIDKVKINMELQTIRVLFHTDLQMQFNNNMDGLLLSVFPVSGKGKGELLLNKMEVEMLFVYDIVKNNNGKDIMDLKKYYFAFDTVDSVLANFENAYGEDMEKTEVFHSIVNENWRVMMANFGKPFEQKITEKLFDVVKKYMRSHPLEELALYK